MVITLYYHDRPITNVFLNVGLQSLYLVMLLETNVFDNKLDRFKTLAGEYFVTLMTFVLLMSTGDFLTENEQMAYLGAGCVYSSIANLAMYGLFTLVDFAYSIKQKIKMRAREKFFAMQEEQKEMFAEIKQKNQAEEIMR